MFVKFVTHSNVAGKGFNFSAVIHKKEGKLISFKNNSEKLANVKRKSKLLSYLLLQMIIASIGRT